MLKFLLLIFVLGCSSKYSDDVDISFELGGRKDKYALSFFTIHNLSNSKISDIKIYKHISFSPRIGEKLLSISSISKKCSTRVCYKEYKPKLTIANEVIITWHRFYVFPKHKTIKLLSLFSNDCYLPTLNIPVITLDEFNFVTSMVLVNSSGIALDSLKIKKGDFTSNIKKLERNLLKEIFFPKFTVSNKDTLEFSWTEPWEIKTSKMIRQIPVCNYKPTLIVGAYPK